jgi:succinate dehydrogenase/fumarate reductase cytochrome b subunit
LSTLLSLLELGATLAWPAELLRLALLPWAALLAGAALAALTTLLPGLSSWTAWAFVERLAALLGLSLTALLSARLAFVLLFAFVLGIFTLCNDQTAIRSADALKRDAQLWNRNRRH